MAINNVFVEEPLLDVAVSLSSLCGAVESILHNRAAVEV